ncbi:HTH-type transcriptional regulator YesS [Paenibacillus marchantiophytorum]|uniref:HTH-type transcriptional regulator YesS n=1 Tax=Paenibacillus marchantiophytorum TaxID=1619310 RepID=A0ABQ1ELS1_9BACL|nr:helix-turn-helix domain-containing protein [Paenibacillus marchantiophytorum]GFZ77577.1 HTH-type transcriptional regulator YesS [Paenibacillus marchantiophytorum]
MKKLQPIYLLIRNRSNSLFLRLVAGFLCIIILLVSLTLYSISVSKSNVRKEIVQYNTLMLNSTMDSYEKHFEMLNKQMHLYLYNEEVQRLQYNPQYINYPILQREMNTWVSNSYLFIDNIVLYAKRDAFVLEKGTSTDASTMFNVFHVSPDYPLEFWQKQFEENYSSRILPSAVFYNEMNSYRAASSKLIPIVYKTKGNNEFMIIVFLDADKMFKAFHVAPSDDFVMYNDLGQTIFNSGGPKPFIALSDLQKDSKALIRHGDYHFYGSGKVSGFTYIHRVPVDKIVSQTRLNITLVAILVLSVTLSIIAALLIAARINNPLQKVIRSTQEGRPLRSSIREFDLISHQLYDKKKTDQQLALFNHLKAIRQDDTTSALLDFRERSYVFVLFHVMGKKNYDWEHVSFQKWLYYMKAFIENELNQSFPDSLTFQIEHNQILSLVFNERRDQLDTLLERMKETFGQDREYGLMTMAVSSEYRHSEHIATAYQEVQGVLGKRRLIDAVQIVSAPLDMYPSPVFTTNQDKEFCVNLREGNVEQLETFMTRYYARWEGEQMSAATLARFADMLLDKIKSEVSNVLDNPGTMQTLLEQTQNKVQECVAVSELELLLQQAVAQAAQAVREKKQQTEQKDPVTVFIMDYVNERYAEDLYLDVLAQQLNLSGGYLSSYFKEKTGMNIVDYINEIRIGKATGMLEQNKLKIHDVAEAVGYRNITSFNRMFKKYTGITPSEFRKKPSPRS